MKLSPAERHRLNASNITLLSCERLRIILFELILKNISYFKLNSFSISLAKIDLMHNVVHSSESFWLGVRNSPTVYKNLEPSAIRRVNTNNHFKLSWLDKLIEVQLRIVPAGLNSRNRRFEL